MRRVREALRNISGALPARRSGVVAAIGLLLVAGGTLAATLQSSAGAEVAALTATLQPRGEATSEAFEIPQRWGRSRRRGFTDEHPDIDIQNMDYNGRFTFNRIRYRPSYWRWGPYAWGLDLFWNHDYPRAEQNLMLMLDELTLIEPNLGGGNVYQIDDPDFFKYPWAYLSEPGTWTMTDDEVEGLRNYLLKGGFLVVDDMRSEQMYVLRENLERTLPGARLEILDTTHPIFHAFFDITQQDIMYQAYTYGMPVIFGVYEDNDPSKRLLVVVNYNQDVGDSWEWSNTGYLPIELSNNAYKLGINYVVYAMTH